MRCLVSLVLSGNEGLLSRLPPTTGGAPPPAAAPSTGDEDGSSEAAPETIPIDPQELIFEVIQVLTWLELYDNRRITVVDRKAANNLLRERIAEQQQQQQQDDADILDLEDDDAQPEDDE